MNEDPQTNIEKPPPVIPPRRIFPQITKEESDDRVRVVEELLLTESEFIKVIQNALLVRYRNIPNSNCYHMKLLLIRS